MMACTEQHGILELMTDGVDEEMMDSIADVDISHIYEDEKHRPSEHSPNITPSLPSQKPLPRLFMPMILHVQAIHVHHSLARNIQLREISQQPDTSAPSTMIRQCPD